MEVHHHPQLEHKPKPWKEYLLEFLMIFLAVMMGFIAENVRESISEHKRAAEFARSYFEDIKKDTAELHAVMHFSRHKIATMDSAVAILHSHDAKRNDTTLYMQLATTSNVMPFEPSAGTYEQIKSSGSLRYFDQRLVNLMNGYDVQVKRTVAREAIDLKFISDQIVPFYLDKFNTEAAYDVYFTHHISHELYGIDWSTPQVRKVINYSVLAKIERMRVITEYIRQMKIANKVLVELKSEYKLE